MLSDVLRKVKCKRFVLNDKRLKLGKTTFRTDYFCELREQEKAYLPNKID
jgi:hypothetical protein